MKNLLVVATVIIFLSCSGSTSSDKHIEKNTATDTTTMQIDSSQPKDTVYPSTDTTSYRKATPIPIDTAK